MAKIIDLGEHSDERGSLCAIEDQLSFQPKRIYWIYNADGNRGGHRHHKCRQALVCVSGSCHVYVQSQVSDTTFCLDSPTKALVVEPEDWHSMHQFSPGSVLVVLASHCYDPDDYIETRYRDQ